MNGLQWLAYTVLAVFLLMQFWLMAWLDFQP